MNRRLLWYLVLLTSMSVVSFFSLINYVSSEAESEMSLLSEESKNTLKQWGQVAESYYSSQDVQGLEQWLAELQYKHSVWAAVVEHQTKQIAGGQEGGEYYRGYNLGRNIDWQIHLYFHENPIMELPFSEGNTSFLIRLPDNMRPGSYWQTTKVILQLVFPLVFLSVLSLIIYRHIMRPLLLLKRATSDFSAGNFDVRVSNKMQSEHEEFRQLATTFDGMATRIGEQLVAQRPLIGDFSHELRTPLTRLDIAIENLCNTQTDEVSLSRITKETHIIRHLVEDTLTFAWLENEHKRMGDESYDVVDLLDSIIDDARFEFPTHIVNTLLPNDCIVENSNHRALGPAIENIVRNALKYSPTGSTIEVSVKKTLTNIAIEVCDQGKGVETHQLEAIFQTFFRLDNARRPNSDSFGMGLALAKRQILSIGGTVYAQNRAARCTQVTGLIVTIHLPLR